MKSCFGLLAATLLLSLPGFSQTAPLGQFAPIPNLEVGERVVGLTPVGTQLGLVTTQKLFTSPFAPSVGLFSYTAIRWTDFNIHLYFASQLAANPANSNELWMDGVVGIGTHVLYRAQPNLAIGGNVTSTQAVLPLSPSQTVQSLASDGTAAYMVVSGQVLKVDPATGNVLPVNFASTNPQQVVRGPDGLIYVLDATPTTGQILNFDTNGLLKKSFPLDQPSVYQANGPMTVSSNGQLYLQTTDASGNLSIDSYDTQIGALLGRTSGAGTFSADQGINYGGHAAMYTTDGNLYYTTGTGAYVWLFSTGPRTPTALDCHGASVSSLTHQYGSMAKAAAALGYPNVSVLQLAVRVSCGN